MASFKKIAFILLISLLITTIQSQQPTILSYIIQHEVQQKQQILQLNIEIQAFDKSLQTALALARQKAQNLQKFQQQICEAMVKDRSQCKHSAIIGTPIITPKYEQKKKQMIYQGVKVHYQLTVTVLNPKNFGKLVDKILTVQGFVITQISWKPKQEQEDQTFLKQGFQKSKQMCKQLGLTMKRLVSVEQLWQQPPKVQPQPEPQEGQQEQQQEQQPQQEPQQQEPQPDQYRITVQCVKKAAKK